MLIKYILYSLISSFIALTMLFLTNKILYAVIVFIIYLIFFIIFHIFFIKKEEILIKKNSDLSYFIHDFIIGYYRNNNIDEGLDFSTLHTSYKVVEELKLLKEFKGASKIEKLADYFLNPRYTLFMRIMLNNNKACPIALDRLNIINNQTINDRLNKKRKLKKELIIYILFWLAAFLILFILKISVTNQLKTSLNAMLYLIGVCLIYGLFLLSNFLFLTNFYRCQV